MINNMDNMNFDLFTPTKLLFGCGKLDELSKQKLPGKKEIGRAHV